MSGDNRRFVVCDVFSDRAFGGNPLAVLPMADGMDGAAMQKVAREFNLSETAFVEPPRRDGDTARVRIFTPNAELPFAGHPNVGTGFVLARLGLVDGEVLRFEELAGTVAVTLRRDGNGIVTGAAVEAPQPLSLGATPDPRLVAAACGLDPASLDSRPHAPVVASTGTPFTVAAVGPEALVRARPDAAGCARLAAATGEEIASVCLHAARPDGTREVRVFAPGHGIPEDPATGSAATVLAALLLSVGGDARLALAIRQGERIGRPSRLEADAWRAADGVRSRVGGDCVLMADGRLLTVG